MATAQQVQLQRSGRHPLSRAEFPGGATGGIHATPPATESGHTRDTGLAHGLCCAWGVCAQHWNTRNQTDTWGLTPATAPVSPLPAALTWSRTHRK